jgi:hypothetical protein
MNNMPHVLKFLDHIQVLQTSVTRKKQYKMGAHGPVISKFNQKFALSSKMNNMPQVVMFSDYIQVLQSTNKRDQGGPKAVQHLKYARIQKQQTCFKVTKLTSFNFPGFCSGLPETKTILVSKTQNQLPLHCR